jgi:hypothetical protein
MKVVEYSGEPPTMRVAPSTQLLARVVEAQLELMKEQLRLLDASPRDFFLVPAGSQVCVTESEP